MVVRTVEVERLGAALGQVLSSSLSLKSGHETFQEVLHTRFIPAGLHPNDNTLQGL